MRALASITPDTMVRVHYNNYREHINADRFVFCAGILNANPGVMQNEREIVESIRVNFIETAAMCDVILAQNSSARICIIGSESGLVGSYDDIYAMAKAALHAYVERKKLLSTEQQLVAIAPSIIEDAGMTLRRKDRDNLIRRRQEHPKRRFIKAIEVARLIQFLLYVDEGYISGVIIRMNGGAHTC